MKKVLNICACVSRSFIDKSSVIKLASTAECAGWEVNIIPDLCELCQCKDERINEISEGVVAACHKRATKSLLEFCGCTSDKTLNIRTEDIEFNIKELGIDVSDLSQDDIAVCESKYSAQLEAMPSKCGEDAWNPVLDKDVCIECGKCYDFCPFGVYEMIEGHVRVVNPTKCKNNCPACARNCPTSAIIFPKYDQSPINGGSSNEEKAVKLETKEIYTVNLKERLSERRNKILKNN